MCPYLHIFILIISYFFIFIYFLTPPTVASPKLHAWRIIASYTRMNICIPKGMCDLISKLGTDSTFC